MWPFKRKPPADFPPKPKWKPTLPVDHAAIIAAFKHYTDGNRAFVVFQHGTCVIVDPASTSPHDEAKSILHQLLHQHPDFNPIEMKDGNWLVSMSDAAFSVCLKAELQQNWGHIMDNHLDGLATDEVLLDADQNPNVFDKRGIIGLFGRARWFMDAQDLVVQSTHAATVG